MSHHQPLIGVVMGSDSDWPTMQAAAVILKEFGVPFEARVVSAHRTPDLLFDYAAMAGERGLKAIIAGAGGAAHLPGMLAAKTTVPVLGVPVQSKALSGVDSLHSIVQMPKAPASCCSSSELILASLKRPAYSASTFSSTGPSDLQGPHQGAQKSTSTGTLCEASMTSVSKLARVTSIMGCACMSVMEPAAVRATGREDFAP